ncbi:hypothetical protein [Streptomyces sp. NPDC086182]|jgi:hypothetical protein|uniref:hypothetical protein n=1 Tax=Streptomyces sp. NPDC086182 TaxID=3155058 RepID=UPI00343BECD1
MLRGKGSKAADSVAAAVARVGQRVAGDKGVQAANKVTGPVLGRTHEKCTPDCNHS